MTIENPYKVRLTSAVQGGGTVSFETSPTVSENRNVNYNSLEPLHAPGQIQVYKNTSSRNFQLSDVRLVSRTVAEAELNLKTLWRLRGWCMPRFGNSSTLNEEDVRQRADITEEERAGLTKEDREFFLGTELLGAPPPILYLSAYSKQIGTKTISTKDRTSNVWETAQHINKVPVVIQQLSIPYPNDVDYITTSDGIPMPLIMNIDLTLLETHSPNSYEAFDLDAYKQGILPGF